MPDLTEREINTLDAVGAAEIENRAMHGDKEEDHGEADEILVEILKNIGFTKTVEAYAKVGKWYT